MEGKYITLRPIKKEDLKCLNKWKNDEEVFKFLGGGFHPISIDQQEKWMDSLIDMTGNNKRFIITDLSGKSIGMIGLYGINWIHRTCEVGIYIGEKDVQHKGYAGEAYNMIERYASDYLNIRKINLNAVSDNIPAISFWSKAGFKKVGELHNERYIKGKYHNLTIMEKFL